MRGGWQQPLPDMPAPPPARAWRRLDAPPGYEAQWRRLAEAALELGLGPDQLSETGLEPLTAARGWKPATVALYSKVARYGGIALPRVATPEPDPPELDLRPLTQIRSEDPEHLRAVAWCALALGWPAPVAAFRSLRRGPGLDSRIGGRLSNQALQTTFTKHAVRTAQHLRATSAPSREAWAEELAVAYRELSYDSYRRLGPPPRAPPVSPRGVVRAARAVSRSSRTSGAARPPAPARGPAGAPRSA